MENKIENLIEAGILDPAKVTRHGLLNACGIAGILLTTQVTISSSSFPLPCSRLMTSIGRT